MNVMELDLMERPGSETVARREPPPFPLTSRRARATDTIVAVGDTWIGGGSLALMAGPCAVEDRAQMRTVAEALCQAGVKILRGGAFKPRTSPYSFQGLGRGGLEILAEVGAEFGLAVVTEVVRPEDVSLVAGYADILQIGSRNMQNFSLLDAVGSSTRPVLLKRGMMSTVEEWLMSAEYILAHGNYKVMLCERGIRTFETLTRNTFDINAIPLLKSLTHLPVVADPSHGTGKWELVGPVARAAVAAGADGLIIEVHPHPSRALSDGAQSLKPDTFARLMDELRAVAQAVGRTL
jgi:3-deoxy-7-phosphoheptulonate synthase